MLGLGHSHQLINAWAVPSTRQCIAMVPKTVLVGNTQADDLDGWWQLKPGARLPSEAELRRMLSPDQWCLYDSTKTGIHRLYELGITKHESLSQIPAERMQIAIEQLPEVCTCALVFLSVAYAWAAVTSVPYVLT